MLGSLVIIGVTLALAWLTIRQQRKRLEEIQGTRYVGDCTRAADHDGPCNGWPCKAARLRLEAERRRQP